jgi:hypothetical protein
MSSSPGFGGLLNGLVDGIKFTSGQNAMSAGSRFASLEYFCAPAQSETLA